MVIKNSGIQNIFRYSYLPATQKIWRDLELFLILAFM